MHTSNYLPAQYSYQQSHDQNSGKATKLRCSVQYKNKMQMIRAKMSHRIARRKTIQIKTIILVSTAYESVY